jgi:hypothetical protein
VHYEYGGLGGAAQGAEKLEIPKAELLAKMKRDQQFLRAGMREAGLL